MAGKKTTAKDAPLANTDAERYFLGALLLSEHAFFEHEQTVTDDMFTCGLHREIYRAIGNVLNRSSRLSQTALSLILPEEADGPDGESVTVIAYLATIQHSAQAASLSHSDLADQLAELAARRKAMAIGERLIRAAKEGMKPAIDIASDAESGLLDVMQISAPKRPRLLADLASNVLHGARKAQDENVMPGLSWGLPTLDELMGLMLPCDLGFILGAQGDGKTALAMQAAAHTSLGGPVLFPTLEMTGEGLAAREIAKASQVAVRQIEEGSFDSFQWDSIREAEKTLAAPQLWLLDDRKLTVRQLRAHAMAMKRTIGLRALFVDQLDKIRTDKFFRDRFERHAEVTSELKDLAKELHVPVVILAQRTRTAQRREDDTPQIDDADAPSIERDGDWVMAVWRKYNWHMRHKPSPHAAAEETEKWQGKLRQTRHSADVIRLKHRRQEPFESRTLKWEGQFTRFSELTP